MNTTAIARYEPMADEQVGLVRRMIAKDATDDELQLFLHQCQRTGLDPFSKQIYAISRWSKDAGRKVMAIQVSIDGARLIAERTGKYDNQEGPFWCGEDGSWKDVWLSKEAPRAAKVLVYKVGSSRATTGIAHWDEYADSKSSFWQNKPALMLAKCAEMLALRRAFPQELSGLYAQEEMEQGEIVDVTSRRVEPSTGEILEASQTHVEAPSEANGASEEGNPFNDTTPYYVTDWNKLSGKEYDLVKWVAALHDSSDGACTAKQYQYLTGIVDALTHSEHNYVLSLLCQSEIDSTNMPGTKVATKLLELLPETVTQKDANGKAVKDENGKHVMIANPAYRKDICEMITAISKVAA